MNKQKLVIETVIIIIYELYELNKFSSLQLNYSISLII